MKTIGKKIKTIYFLAVIALVSMCMAIIPLMPTNVKADAEAIKVVGAKVTVIDETTSSQNFDGKYAVSFQAEFAKTFYESINVGGKTVKFGMLVGPAANYDAVSSIDTAIQNGYVDTCFLGNKDVAQYVNFKSGETTYVYEGIVEYNEADIVAGKTTEAEKIDALLTASAEDLSAIPYYSINGTVNLVKEEQPIARSARELINDEYALNADLEYGDELYSRYVGNFDGTYTGAEYYIEQSTGKVYKSDANGSLVPFYATDFVGGGQLVVAAQDVTATALDEMSLLDIMDMLEVGEEYSIAVYDNNTVKSIKARVVTKILSSINDFFNDVDGNGVGDVAAANYIFHLEPVKNTYDGNYTTPTVIDGYYVLGGNIDFADTNAVVAASGDVRFLLKEKTGGFQATLDGRGFAISNINVGTCASGMFGLLNGATIKDIAFDGIMTNRNDSAPGLFAHNTYNSTFENVYIRAKAYPSNVGDGYVSMAKAFGSLNPAYGASTFTNVIYENSDALVDGNVKKFDRVTFSNDETSTYTNTSIIGLPSHFTQTAHATDTENRVLTLYVSSAAMTKLGVEAREYALADCPAAVTTAYAGLIKNIQTKFEVTIGYITFVEDTVRNYYVNNAELLADTTATQAYTDTGLWVNAGDKLAWNSLVTETISVKSTNVNPLDMTFTSEITLEMFKGNEKLDNVSVRVRSEYAHILTASGATITKTPGSVLITDSVIPVEVVHTADDGTTYELTVNLTLELDVSTLPVYESAEFVLERLTGKLFKTNSLGELVVYDATDYVANATSYKLGGIETSLLNINPFAIDATVLEELENGKKYLLEAVSEDSSKYLVVEVVTKVISTVNDFYKDVNLNGVVEDEEIIPENYIFYLDYEAVSGGHFTNTKIEGYYVLANNIDLQNKSMNASGEKEVRYMLPTAGGDVGFAGTFDGRGFALSNLKTFSSAGFFGMLNNATIKNVAFDGIVNTRNDGGVNLLTYRVYGETKVENVYIRTIAPANTTADSWNSSVTPFGGISAAYGKPSFTNVIFENTAALAEGVTAKHARATWGNDAAANYANVNIIGMPSYYKYAAHATDTEKYVLTLNLPSATMTALGVEAREYALADCPAAVTSAYGNLINNLNTKFNFTIGYITFVEDASRGYYLNSASLAADATVANAYVASGCWTQLGEALAWKSIITADNFVVKSTNEDPTNMMFKDEITLEMYLGAERVDGAVVSIADEYASLVEINGMTISKKASAVLTKDEIIPVTVTYSQGGTSYSKSVNVTLQLDLNEVEIHESGEFVIDITTGKVFKANDANELVVYDATGLTENMTSMYVAGNEVTVLNTTELTLSTAEIAGLALNEELAVSVVFDGGARYIRAKAVTRVFSTLADFFLDADESGAVEDAELVPANYIFNLGIANHNASKKVTGYYVLANNIDTNFNGGLIAESNSNRVDNYSSDVGFQATLDGRGFAISNIKAFNGSGMFGLLKNATIKNIAFINMHNSRDDGSVCLIASNVVDSTIENVYITIAEYWLGWNQTNRGPAPAFGNNHTGAIRNSTFTNVLFENNAWKSDVANTQKSESSWIFFTNTNAAGTFNNVNVIGLPGAISHAVEVAAEGEAPAQHKLVLKLPLATINKYVAAAGTYALADCGGAEVDYANLIKGINAGDGRNIQFIEFVEDTSTRGYFYDAAALADNTTVANAYVAGGCWTQLGDIIAWKSLVNEENFLVNSTNTDPTNMMFTNSITLEMYYGSSKLENVVTTIDDEFSAIVDIEGTTISKKAGAVLTKDTIIPVTLTYAGSYVKVVNVTLQLNLEEITVEESGEFILDKTTGELFKADKDNKLVAYDATNLTADMTGVYIAGAEVEVKDTTAFTVDPSALADLPVNEEFAIAVSHTSGARYLKVKAATRVFTELRDFFVDANGDKTIADDEMTQANNFFNLAIANNAATVKISGYYVLANNIDFGNSTALSAASTEGSPNNTNEDFGFQGTFDGRGFAISNIRPYNVAGLFGLIKNATIKDIAFIGISNDRNNGSRTYLARHVVDSTIENVYISITETHWVGWNQGDTVTAPVFNSISNSTLTNVMFENNAWKKDAIRNRENSWTYFSPVTTTATYTNTNLVGAPSTLVYTTHIKAADADDGVAKHKLVFTLPLDVITKYVAAPGVYALADCSGAEVDYANLIAGIGAGEASKGANIQFIEFVADTTARGYYYDNAALAANATATNAYLATGLWAKVGDSLVWKSTLDLSQVTLKVADDGKFVDSIAVEMLYGDAKLDGIELSVSEADAEFVEISGNVVARKAGVQVLENKTITVTASYSGVTLTTDLTLLFDFDSVITYEAGEFVIDKSTGKVLKANESNQLVAYDATSYIGTATEVVVGDVAPAIVSKTEFAFDKADLATLADGDQYILTAGDNLLVARVVTRVLTKLEDFFNDMNNDGVIKNLDLNADGAINTTVVGGVSDLIEITTTNSIFNLPYTGSGNHQFTAANTGYYVLGNNINLNYSSAIGFASGDIRPYIPSDLANNTGFMGTLDGRGFAISKPNAGNGPGGIFGMLNGATIKNIAFKDFYSTKNDGTLGLLAYKTYRTTFENVYISVAYPGDWGDNYITESSTLVFGSIDNKLGVSTFKNVIVENTKAFTSGNKNKMARFMFGDFEGDYTNLNLVGMPTYFKYAAHATEAGNAVLTLKIPAAELTKLGVTVGEYAIANCEAAATAYAGLITNLQTRNSTTIAYINFVVDESSRGHYVDNAALSADTTVADAYVATGYWTLSSGVLAWAK